MADQIPDSAKSDDFTLLPCPFCGGGAQLVISVDGDYVECGSCLATMPPHDPDVPSEFDRWNTRAAPPAMDREAVEADGWIAVKVNGEGCIVMPYGPMRAGPDQPNDPRYRWLPFYLGDAAKALSYDERLAYEERVLALEMDIEALKKGEQPIYAGLTAREIGMGTYHPGDEA